MNHAAATYDIELDRDVSFCSPPPAADMPFAHPRV